MPSQTFSFDFVVDQMPTVEVVITKPGGLACATREEILNMPKYKFIIDTASNITGPITRIVDELGLPVSTSGGGKIRNKDGSLEDVGVCNYDMAIMIANDPQRLSHRSPYPFPISTEREDYVGLLGMDLLSAPGVVFQLIGPDKYILSKN